MLMVLTRSSCLWNVIVERHNLACSMIMKAISKTAEALYKGGFFHATSQTKTVLTPAVRLLYWFLPSP